MTMMKRGRLAWCAVAAFALPTAAAALGSLEAPPAGIAPTATSLAAVLDANARAQGTPAPGFGTRERLWSVAAYGLVGSSAQFEQGDDQRETITLGPFTQSRGTVDGRHWWQNENGLTVELAGVHQRDAIDDRALDNAAKHLPSPGVRLLGESRAPIDAYVVEVDPMGGRREWLFYEAATGRLIRKEAVVVDRRVVTTYDDFRTVGGRTEPWHYRIDDGRPANVEDWRETSLVAAPHQPTRAFGPPLDARTVVEFPAGERSVRLPTRIENRKIIVRVVIGGRGLDFMLDSGASGIVLDAATAKSLGLTFYGRSIRETAGAYDESSALVPEMSVGEIHMRTIDVSVLPFESQLPSNTEVVGLLGFDFIDGAVLRIDYEHGTVDAFPPETPPALPASAVSVPAALDDGVPDISAGVGSAIGPHFILDTGATSGVLFSAFADGHPSAVADEGLGFRLLRDHPMQFAGGVGGTLSVRPTQVKSFGVPTETLPDFLAYIVRGSPSYEGEDQDGLIGYDYLQYFTIYLDYRRSRIGFVRNDVPYAEQTIAPEEAESP